MTKFCANCGFGNEYDLLTPKYCFKCKKSFSSAFTESFEFVTKPAPKRPSNKRLVELEDEYNDDNDNYEPIKISKLDVEIDTFRGTTAKFGDVAQSQKTGVAKRDRPKNQKISDKDYWEQIRQESATSKIDIE